MRAASPVISLSFAACLLASASVHGMGFGRVANGTQLGQPLDFSAVVKLDADESLARECVFAEVTAGENRLPASLVRVSVAGVQGDAERVVRVSTGTPIDEPVVTVDVTLGCTSKVTRQFVAFVDPPGPASMPLASSAAVLAPPVGPGPAVAPRMPDPRAAEAAVPRRPAASQASAGRVTAVAEPARRPLRPASARAVAPAGPRLQLDSPAVAVAAAPVAAAPAAASAPAAPPVAAPAASAPTDQAAALALAQERLRMQSLEDEMARLRAESRAQRQALASLQLQVGTTRSQRYANPLVYTLAALCLLLTTAVCALLGRRSRDRAASRWLTSTLLARSIDTVAPAAAAPPVLVDRMMPAASVDTAPVAVRPAAPVRSSSVDELIDLEQQADFFVALGQDDAAVDLLNGHLDGDPAASAVPLLMLLEIHRRSGDRAEYERIRARVDARFNARTPGFDADPARGRTLADHPGLVARLQSLWSTPVSARDALHALVFRSAESDETFDLPAFRELLLLLSIAGDHVDRSGPAEPPRLPTVAARPTSAAPAAAARPLDVDLTAAPKRPATGGAPPPGRTLPVLTAMASKFDNFETVPSALRRPPDYANESTFVDLELEFPGLQAAPTLPR